MHPRIVQLAGAAIWRDRTEQARARARLAWGLDAGAPASTPALAWDPGSAAAEAHRFVAAAAVRIARALGRDRVHVPGA